MVREFAFPDAEALAAGLADRIAGLIADALDRRGRASIALSGGRSPIPLFERLARAKLDWARVDIAQVDERWVAADDPASNGRLIREHLLKERAAAARFVPMRNDAATADDATESVETALRPLLPFDAVLLGMGEDGHTASLFPKDAALAAGLDPDGERLVLPARAPVPPHERMTLTLAALLNSRVLLLQLTGDAKLRTYGTAGAAGSQNDMPVRAVLRQQRVPVEVWHSR